MCHEKYHVSPELRAVVNTMVGLPAAEGSAERLRCQDIARMVINKALLVGLMDCLDSNFPLTAEADRGGLRLKLRSLEALSAAEALDWLAHDALSGEDIPF